MEKEKKNWKTGTMKLPGGDRSRHQIEELNHPVKGKGIKCWGKEVHAMKIAAFPTFRPEV